jgi:hypothetical protein
LIALYNSLDVDGDKNLSREELKKGMERLQRISLVEAKRRKGNHAANALKMALIMDQTYDLLIQVDEEDESTKSSSGFTLPTLLKAYRASKRRHHYEVKNKGTKGIDFDKLEEALGQVNELAFIVDYSPAGVNEGTSRDEMTLGMRIHGLRVTKVVPNSQCELGGVAEGDVITKIGAYQGKTDEQISAINVELEKIGKTHGKTDEQINVELEEKVRELLTEAKKDKKDITILLDTSARATSVFDKGKRHLRNGSASFRKAVAAKVKGEVDAADKQLQDATGLSALDGVDDNAGDATTNAEYQGESDAVKDTGPKLEYETYFFKGESLTHESIDRLNAVAGDALAVGHQVTWKAVGKPDYHYGVLNKVKGKGHDYWEFSTYNKFYVESNLMSRENAQLFVRQVALTKEEDPEFIAEREMKKEKSLYCSKDEQLTGGWAKPEAKEAEAGSTKPKDQAEAGTAYANFLKSAMKSFDLFIDFADRMVTLGKITTFAVSYLCYTTALICYLLPTLVTFPSVIFVFVVTAWIWFGLYITFVVIVTLTTLLLLKRSPHLAQQWLSKEWWKWFRLPELTPLIARHHMRKLFRKCIYYTANEEIYVDGR